MSGKENSGSKKIKTFVLRKGKMTTGQRRAYDELFAEFRVEYDAKGRIDSGVFGNEGEIIVEIGFGMGDATWQIAAKHPQKNYLGFEVHAPGIGKLLSNMALHNVENIRIMQHDAVEAIEQMIADDSIAGFHIFFPDPWQKKRHHKRRLIQPALTELLLRKLRRGGYIFAVTDWLEYAEQMAEVFEDVAGLSKSNAAHPWRPETKFEAKGRQKDHVITELLYEKT